MAQRLTAFVPAKDQALIHSTHTNGDAREFFYRGCFSGNSCFCFVLLISFSVMEVGQMTSINTSLLQHV